MSKKLQLFCIALLCSLFINGQNPQTNDPNHSVSGTGAPSQQWDNWFNDEVEKYVKNRQVSRTEDVNYRIPVVFHIIHTGQAVGTYPNIDSSQITSQMRVLNADYSGSGFSVGNVPAPFAALVANTKIQFCLARRTPAGALLSEPGIERLNATNQGWSNPTATTSIVNYINAIKASSIWDPTRYLNIWISDRTSTLTILGFATFPANTALVGIPNNNLGTASNDGVWCWTQVVGTIGSVTPPYHRGRTLTTEIAHWLGVRNIWGDGNCLDDYCSDTPWAKQANTGCPFYPSFVNRCGIGQSPDGEMTMNFMDGTYDSCKYMFTPRQATRMQTAMSQCFFRNQLGTHNLCATFTQVAAPCVAGFTINEIPCVGVPLTPNNTSTGWPNPTFQWSSAPSATISPAPAVASPNITFPSAGIYTLYLVATHTANSSSYTMAVNVVNCPASPLCLDTIRMIKKIDTLATYKSANSAFVTGCQTGFAGYLTGTNCYRDKEFAQFYPASTYSNINLPQVNSVIVLFDSVGTKSSPLTPGTQISCILYGGSAGSGPNGGQLAIKNDSLKVIAAGTRTTNVKFVGNPNSSFSLKRIIPFKFDFAQPCLLTPNAPGFFASIQTPFISQFDSIRIFSNTKTNLSIDSSSWVLLNPSNNWRTMRFAKGVRLQLAILPQITCRPIVSGINEIATEFNSNITIMPNPSNGQFSLIFTLSKVQDLNINVYNAVGQRISAERLENVTHQMADMDLSSKSDGIYFIEISNGEERVTKKIIISH
jgi:hypothetical protein